MISRGEREKKACFLWYIMTNLVSAQVTSFFYLDLDLSLVFIFLFLFSS